MNQAQFTPQEIQLITNQYRQDDDISAQAFRLVALIYEKLSVVRSLDQIKQYLMHSYLQGTFRTSLGPNISRNSSANLFKSFEDSHKIVDNHSNSLARPAPRRKNVVTFHSKRKISKRQMQQVKPTLSVQAKLDQIEKINEQCNYTFDKNDRKLNRKLSFKDQNINLTVLSFYHELFYSNYDKKYFQSNKWMAQIYEQLNFKQITLKNHKELLLSLPKPLHFNDQFVVHEKLRLQQHRNSCRHTTKNLTKINEPTTQFPVHSIVLALHPLCGHLHTGSIMAYYKQNLYMVRFLRPELPAYKILDVNMSTQFTNTGKTQVKNENALEKEKNNMNNENSQSDIVDSVNFQITAYLIKLLAFKTELIKLIRSINDKVDKKQNVSPSFQSSKISKPLFEWANSLICKLDPLIQQSLLRFRLRGVNEANSCAIYGNLKNILLNPLKLMSKEFQNSSQQSDMNAAMQIKQIIAKQRESHIMKAYNNGVSALHREAQLPIKKSNGSTEGNRETPQIKQLIYYCLGILSDLKYEGKQFDIENNEYLVKLAQSSGQVHSQIFNEIYERLFSILNKIKE